MVHRQTYKYIEQRLGLVWRRKLTEVCKRAFAASFPLHSVLTHRGQDNCTNR